jgi:hypothetical protein
MWRNDGRNGLKIEIFAISMLFVARQIDGILPNEKVINKIEARDAHRFTKETRRFWGIPSSKKSHICG